jgi:hypothetical protein
MRTAKLRAILLTTLAWAVSGCANTSPLPTQEPSPTASIPTATQLPTATPLPDWMTGINWTALRRPLNLPLPAADAACPVTPARADMPGVGSVLGDGPVFPWGTGHVPLADLFHIGDRYRLKVLWIVDYHVYDGPVLIRGGRMGDDQEALVFYGLDQDATAELRLGLEGWVSGGTGLREFNSGTGFPGPGCFAYQIDGIDLTDFVVVEVVD